MIFLAYLLFLENKNCLFLVFFFFGLYLRYKLFLAYKILYLYNMYKNEWINKISWTDFNNYFLSGFLLLGVFDCNKIIICISNFAMANKINRINNSQYNRVHQKLKQLGISILNFTSWTIISDSVVNPFHNVLSAHFNRNTHTRQNNVEPQSIGSVAWHSATRYHNDIHCRQHYYCYMFSAIRILPVLWSL